MNRFTNLSVSRFDPLSWEDISRVPLARRTKHNAMNSAMAELDTNIGAIDGLDVHDEKTQQIQQEYRDKLEQLTKSLATEGSANFATEDILKLNSQYKKDWAPGGRANAINEAKVVKKANEAREMAWGIKDGYNAQQVADYMKAHDKYTGFDKEGNVISPEQQYMTKFHNTKKEIDDAFKGAAASIDTLLGGEGWYTKTIGGEQVFYNKDHKTVKGSNLEQIKSVMTGIQSIYGNELSTERIASEIQGYGDANDIIQTAAGKYGFTNINKTRNEKLKFAPKAAKTNITVNNVKDPVLAKTTAVRSGQQLVTNYTELQAKIKASNLLKKTDKNSKTIGENRHWNNMLSVASIGLEQNKEYTDLNQEVEENLADVKTAIDAQKGVYGKAYDERLNTVYTQALNGENIDMSIIQGISKSPITDKAGKMLDKIKVKVHRLNEIKDDHITSNLHSTGKEVTSFRRIYSKQSEQKLALSNSFNLLRDNADIFDGGTVNFSFNNDNYDNNKNTDIGKKYTKKVMKLILGGGTTNKTFDIVTDGGKLYAKMGGTPKNGVVLPGSNDGAFFDTINDRKFTGGETLSAMIPLTDTVDGIIGLTSYAKGLIASQGFEPGIRDAMYRKLEISAMTPTLNSNELGDQVINNKILGNGFMQDISIGTGSIYKGVDLLRNKAGKINMYRAGNDDNKGKSSIVKISDIIDDMDNGYYTLRDSGILRSYVTMVQNTSAIDYVTDQLDTAKERGLSNKKIQMLTTMKETYKNSKATMGQIIGLQDKFGNMKTKYDENHELFNKGMQEEDITRFRNFIFDQPLQFDNVENVLKLRDVLKQQKN